jgi:hypothetical protein
VAKTGMWDSWQQTVSRGRIALLRNSFAYGMLAKTGAGLLGSYRLLKPSMMPVELDLRISVPLFLLALTERLTGARSAGEWARFTLSMPRCSWKPPPS